MTDALPVRRAVVADAPALTGLRAQMLADMGVDVGPPDAPWRAAATAWFALQLPRLDEVAAFVAVDPVAGVVSCALGVCERRAPGPANPTGRHGHVSNVSTEPVFRRRGLARACLEALLGWFDAETPVRAVDLNATGDGGDLYRSLAFVPPRFEALQRRR